MPGFVHDGFGQCFVDQIVEAAVIGRAFNVGRDNDALDLFGADALEYLTKPAYLARDEAKCIAPSMKQKCIHSPGCP